MFCAIKLSFFFVMSLNVFKKCLILENNIPKFEYDFQLNAMFVNLYVHKKGGLVKIICHH